MSGKRRRIDWRLWVLIVGIVLIAAGPWLFFLGLKCFNACFSEGVPEFSAAQLESAVVERPPGTLSTTIDLSEPNAREELLAAYAKLSPWGEERGGVSPDVELRLQLVDGRTIGVAAQEGNPGMLVRLYQAGKIESELVVAGTRMMYDFFYPDSKIHYPYYTGTT